MIRILIFHVKGTIFALLLTLLYTILDWFVYLSTIVRSGRQIFTDWVHLKGFFSMDMECYVTDVW